MWSLLFTALNNTSEPPRQVVSKLALPGGGGSWLVAVFDTVGSEHYGFGFSYSRDG